MLNEVKTTKSQRNLMARAVNLSERLKAHPTGSTNPWKLNCDAFNNVIQFTVGEGDDAIIKGLCDMELMEILEGGNERVRCARVTMTGFWELVPESVSDKLS